MSKIINIVITSSGPDLGPYTISTVDDLSNVVVIDSNVPKSALLPPAGYTTTVDNNIVSVRIKSVNCSYKEFLVPRTTTLDWEYSTYNSEQYSYLKITDVTTGVIILNNQTADNSSGSIDVIEGHQIKVEVNIEYPPGQNNYTDLTVDEGGTNLYNNSISSSQDYIILSIDPLETYTVVAYTGNNS
jgi:hypothetical protein